MFNFQGNFWKFNAPVRQKKNRSLQANSDSSHNLHNSRSLHKSIQESVKSEKIGFDRFFHRRSLSKSGAVLPPSVSKPSTEEESLSNYSEKKKKDMQNPEQMEYQLEYNPHEDVVKVLKQISSSELLSPEDLMLAKRIHDVQGASVEANHLLGSLEHKDALSEIEKHLLEYNEEKAGSLLRDTRKSPSNALNMRQSIDSNITSHPWEQGLKLDQRKSQSPNKHQQKNKDANSKKYYCKWYVPVKFWGHVHHEDLRKEANNKLKEGKADYC